MLLTLMISLLECLASNSLFLLNYSKMKLSISSVSGFGKLIWYRLNIFRYTGRSGS